MTDILDAKETRRRAEEGMARVDAAARASWLSAVDESIERVARRLVEFTADDLWEDIPTDVLTSGNTSGLGPRLNAAAARGLIEATDKWRRSIRPATHGHVVVVWKFRGDGAPPPAKREPLSRRVPIDQDEDCFKVTPTGPDSYLVQHFPDRKTKRPCCRVDCNVTEADRAKAIPDADPHGHAAALARAERAIELAHRSS